jgi:hypothetical protein
MMRRAGSWKVWVLFLFLLAGLGVGIWGTLRAVLPEKGVYRVTGVYKDRWGETMILVQHDPVPGLMETMDFMSFFVESKELLDGAKLNKGDRVRFTIKQVPDRLLIVKIEKIQ